MREVLAQQLPRLAPLLKPDSMFFGVVPVAFGLLNDPVAVVREKTFEVCCLPKTKQTKINLESNVCTYYFSLLSPQNQKIKIKNK